MRGLDESTDVFVRTGQKAQEQVRHAWHGFINFAARDNVLEVALGLIIANAFTKVVTSFVSDMVLPIISLLPFLNRNMDQKFAVLSKGPNFDQQYGYNTLHQAREDGALVLAYGYVNPPQLLTDVVP
ncbi:Large-conductance mechanosensitive channel [Penicillium italicum]|uniref:Large-conductance mechanosensitive channel n=1 Tax=Penicillium italicum TaxID=40296 RepID=A0A0A2L5C2_PENIT|nr:Large-conductance mechanosensitive channel [Penicillium italicum]